MTGITQKPYKHWYKLCRQSSFLERMKLTGNKHASNTLPIGYWLAAIVVYATVAVSITALNEGRSTTKSVSRNLIAVQVEGWENTSPSLAVSINDKHSVPFPQLDPDISPLNLTAPPLQSLQPIDREQYTLRINTWRRPNILLQNVAYYSTCEGIAEIQIVWCDTENEPPEELYNITSKNIKVDRRSINSLNERYNLTGIGAPTLGIIHVDDDDIYPCIALDHLFFKWTYNPERLVALQPRVHDEKNGIYYGWSRHPKAALENIPKGRYTMALPTLAGIMHRDYLDWYMRYFPRPFFHDIARQFNCEDIALSFFITALTQGKPPLLGDFWAMQSSRHVTDYTQQQASAISANGNTHKVVRHNCTKRALHELGLDLVPYKNMLTSMIAQGTNPVRFDTSKRPRKNGPPPATENDWFQLNFEVGAVSQGPSSIGDTLNMSKPIVSRHSRILMVIDQWKASPQQFKEDTFVANKGKPSRLFNKVY